MNAKIIERDRRLKIFNTIMEQKNLDALVFTSTAQQTCQMAVKYATNYPLTTRRDFAYMAKGEMPYLLVPTVGQQYHAGLVSWLPQENILCGDLLEYVIKFIKSLPAVHPRIGLYESSQIPVSIYRTFEETGAEFLDITDILTEMRTPKSEYEIDLIKLSSKIAVESFEWVVRNIDVGSTEWELIGGAEGYLRTHGAEETLVLTRSEKPHTFIAKPKNVKVLKDGIFVYSCEMAGPGGYWTQLVRPIFMSRGCQPEAYDVLQVIKEALAAGEEKMRVGYRICDVNTAIDEVVKKHGCKAGVWSGHGMGADLGDGVDIGDPNKMEIVPGMVLTLHPSVIAKTDGLLYGNTYMATEDKPLNLTAAYMDSCYLEDLKAQVG